jgi:hypothetical protein
MHLREKECESVDWIHLEKDKVQWWVLLNTTLNNQIPLTGREFLSHYQLLKKDSAPWNQFVT